MDIIVGCEESQAVCIALRERGHNAFSCDLEPPSGGYPEWHLQMDVLEATKTRKWDAGLFFPPCTYLTVTGNAWFNVDKYGDKAIERHFLRHEALGFCLKLWFSGIPKIMMENPIGYLSSAFRKPDQIVQPYYFGDEEQKPLCLWLKNLPKLHYVRQNTLFEESTFVEPVLREYKNGGKDPRWHFDSLGLPAEERAKFRSKTFQGFARAIAEQWF